VLLASNDICTFCVQSHRVDFVEQEIRVVMPAILIDANIYLQLFESNTAKRLLPTLLELKERIFVTDQLVNEVDRNKLRMARKFLEEHLKSLKLPHLEPPDLLVLGMPEGDDSLKRKFEAAYQASMALRSEVDDLIRKKLFQISQGVDEVSSALSLLFRGARAPTEKQLERARMRRENGWPPGKPDDPLGDQLTWEQFLEQLPSGADVWIVTADQDYFEEYGNTAFLQPSLSKDLLMKNARGWRVITSLSSFGSEVKRAKDKLPEVRDLPSEEDLKKIQLEIARAKALSPPTGVYLGGRMFCPRCRGNEAFDGPFVVSSPEGPRYNYSCLQCGAIFDANAQLEAIQNFGVSGTGVARR
jgi:hypothetical protein